MADWGRWWAEIVTVSATAVPVTAAVCVCVCVCVGVGVDLAQRLNCSKWVNTADKEHA